MTSQRKFYRSTFWLEVLSEDPIPDLNLNELAHEITYGDCSGNFKEVKINEEIDAKKCAKLLQEQGSDPKFFQLTEEGEDVDCDCPECLDLEVEE